MSDVRGLIDRVLDSGSWVSWDRPARDRARPGSEYARSLARARERSGSDESVVTGEGRLLGRRVAVMACDFSFLGGSIGVVSAERLVGAVERATAERLPLLAAPASGGTRMQEGTVAFVQMATIAGAVHRHKAAGLPYLVYLRDPTTGGVFASWGSLGHVTAAAPGALVGFLGPRVAGTLHGRPLPAGVQTAENLYRHGLLDAVVRPDELPEIVSRVLDVVAPAAPAPSPVPVPPSEGLGVSPGPSRGPSVSPGGQALTPRSGGPAAERGRSRPRPASTADAAAVAVERTRRPDRPGVGQLLRSAATHVTPLNGTGAGERGPALLLALARFGWARCVVLGQDRDRERRLAPLGPADLRVARRGMRLAAELRIPLVTVIDTAGAAMSRAAEEGGLAAEIAHCLAELLALPTPTVCVLLGQGAGGGALALLPADRVVAAEHAWLAPLPPEGSAAVLRRTAPDPARVAAMQRILAADLCADGIVDRVIAERPDAAEEGPGFLTRVARSVEHELVELQRRAVPVEHRLAARLARYRAIR